MRALLTAITFAAASLICTSAKADQEVLLQCISKFKGIGLSADLAYSECKKNTLGECIKGLVGKNFVARSTEKKAEGYLIDLGNNDSRWLEGGAWKELGCTPYGEGPKRRQQNMTVWGFDSVNTWFRQGVCSSNAIELKQPYAAEEAKTLCEIQDLGVNKKDN
jgi:hypothetical protein